MTVQEFYDEVGGDYNEIMSRLKTEERVKKFVGMFGKDQSFQTLTKSIKSGDVDEAFRAAHTMKGMCQNMAFTRLYQSSHDITETLRGKDLETAKAQINIVTKDYNRVLTGIYKLLSW